MIERLFAYSSDSGQSFLLIPDACSGGIRTLWPERSDAGFFGYFNVSSPIVKFLFFSHGTSFQLKAVSVMGSFIKVSGKGPIQSCPLRSVQVILNRASANAQALGNLSG
jgi:hypothetical protein